MKLLLDANISKWLVPKLKFHFEDCFHVDYIGLPVPVKDADLWYYAFINSLIIVTNDCNFLNLISVRGVQPKVVMLRTKDQSNTGVADLLIKHSKNINSFLHSNEYKFLEIL